MAKAELSGFEELDGRLTSLIEMSSKATGRNALQRALNASANPILTAAKAAAPVGPTGNLRDSLVISRKAHDGAKNAKVKDGVGVFVRSTAPHAHLVEFGTGPRVHKSSGKSVGVMPPNPFLSRAFDESKDQALSQMGANVGAEIEKAWARAERRAAKKAAQEANQ